MLRITAYAERLIDELDGLDWPEGIKLLQRNWIGRSEGAEVRFPVRPQISNCEIEITVFTTRPDTLFGATYMVLAPEHPLVDEITTPRAAEAVEAYREKPRARATSSAPNWPRKRPASSPAPTPSIRSTAKSIPIWIADYVLMGYGTGAIMAVPAHDERDFEFAKKFGLPIRKSCSRRKATDPHRQASPATASRQLRLPRRPATPEAKRKITAWLERKRPRQGR
jgi:leucyl-tRNA synthetase